MTPTTECDRVVDAKMVDDLKVLVGFAKRLCARTFRLMESQRPGAMQLLNAELRAGIRRLTIEFDVSYPGALALVSVPAGPGADEPARVELARVTLDPDDRDYLRVALIDEFATDDAAIARIAH